MCLRSMEIIVKTQQELDAIKPDFSGTIYIEGGTLEDPIVYKKNFSNAYVVSRGTACMVLEGDAQVKEMWGSSQVKEMRGSSQVKEMWRNSQVKEMWGSSQVKEMWESSQVGVMWGSSQVKEMWESSQIGMMWESSQIGMMWGSSQVKEMWGSSQVKEMRGNSQVGVMWRNSQVKEMWESSQVELYGESYVSAYSAKAIICHGYNIVRLLQEKKDIQTLVVNKESHLILIPKFKPTWNEYMKRYPVEVKGKKVTMYKAVHKTADGVYFSDYAPGFKYKIGETHVHENAPQEQGSCAPGLHVAHKSWACAFGAGWGDFALLECEVETKHIVVSEDCDGKVRCSQMTVTREVSKEEYGY